MNLALHRQLEAQSALNRMINEKNLVRSMIQGQANDIKQIYFLSDTLVFSEPLKALQKAEGLLNKIQKGDPAYAWASMQLAYIFSLRQDFSQACQFFEISSNDPPLLKLSQKYARLQKKSALLTPKQLMDYWDELLVSKYRISDALKMLKYDSELRSKPTEHFKLVEYMLKVINPHWDKQAFIYDHTKGNLKISGQGFYRLAFKKNEFFLTGKKPTERIFIFRPGEIKQLDISDSSFSDLNFLLGSEIQELNICRTKITDLTPIRKMAQLRKIILDRDDMNLKDIPSQIQVEYK
jgi:hypothetical protein